MKYTEEARTYLDGKEYTNCLDVPFEFEKEDYLAHSAKNSLPFFGPPWRLPTVYRRNGHPVR